MKKKREHVVPLSSQAIQILEETYELSGRGKYIFPARGQYGKCMSENTVLYALRRMGYGKDEIVAHGFRHMASTILNENGWNDEAIELQLSHVKQGKIKRIYDKSKLLPLRVKMIQWWADYLYALRDNCPIPQTI
jgi:integrase